MKNFVDVEERLSILKTIPLSLQYLFAMVGATILVPMVTTTTAYGKSAMLSGVVTDGLVYVIVSL